MMGITCFRRCCSVRQKMSRRCATPTGLNDPSSMTRFNSIQKNVLSVSVGGSRGKLATEQDTETFYTDLAGWIEGAYKSRAEFQQLSIENQ